MMEEPSFAPLREAPPPPIDRVYARVRRRRLAKAAAGSLASVAVAAAVLLALVPASTRDRGLSGAPLVGIDAVALREGYALRPLADGATVSREERVVFMVRTSEAGTATLTEHGLAGEVVVWPSSGMWQVDGGEQTPGGSSPLSWRPDGGPGQYRYEASVCSAPDAQGACGHASLHLVWAP